jgi:hypothetical protein
MVVEVDPDVYTGDPTQHHRRCRDKSNAGPWSSDANQCRMPVEPKRARIRGEAKNMEDQAVPVLRIGENAPAANRGQGISLISAQSNLKAAVTVRTVIARLTQGPQSIAPAMTAIANRGQNDLANISAVCDRKLCGGRVMPRSFLFKLSFAVQCMNGRKDGQRPGAWICRASNLRGDGKLQMRRISMSFCHVW